MANPNSTLPIARVFSNLFRGLPRLILTNLLFALPTAVFFSIFYAINTLTGLHSVFILLLTVIPAFPFYAGVVKVSLHIAKGDEDVAVCSNFFAAVKENFLRFLIHGVLFYIAAFFTWSSTTMYFEMGKENNIFFALMIISIVIGILLMCFFFRVPTMTVAFDLPMKAIYKNSLLMGFMEVKSNLAAIFGLFILFVICSMLLVCCGGNAIAIAIVTALLGAVLVPAVAAFIINAAVWQRMYIMVTDSASEARNVDKKILEKRRELEEYKKRKNRESVREELNKLELDDSADDDEYVYFNGKMMKKSVLRKMKQDAEESEGN